MSDTLTMSAVDVARNILEGDFDGDLDALMQAISERRKDVRKREARLNAMTLKPGDRVRLKGLTPKLLNGAVVEVGQIRNTRVVVKSIDGTTDFLAAQRIGSHGTTVPLVCVEKVED